MICTCCPPARAGAGAGARDQARARPIRQISLIHPGIQIHHDVDGGDQDLGGDEDDDDPFEVFA